MKGGLPADIDPFRLGAEAARIQGELALKDMPRLLSQCADARGRVTVDLLFGQAGDGTPQLNGEVRARVHVICQRCLEPFGLELRAGTRLRFRRPGAAAPGTAAEADELVVEKSTSLAALVEDELLLAMPMIPKHALPECPAAGRMQNRETEPAAGESRSPFAVLEKLKQKSE